MPVNPDAAQMLKVEFADPRPGSCVSKAVLAELKSLIRISLPAAAFTSGSGACASKDANSLASIDAEGCVLVPAAKLYEEEQTWEIASGADLEFTDFADLGYDASTCMMGVLLFLDSGETGKTAAGSPSGTVNVRPSWETKERSAGKVIIAVKNAMSDVRVVLQLLQLPTPPQQA
jgi:hypothetical protein